MRPTDVAEVIESLLPIRQPLYLWGPPGVGKSSLVRQACERKELRMIDIRAVLLDPVDLRGLPTIDQASQRACWCPPSFLPHAGEGVIFFDELAQAPPLVQAGLLQLILDRRIGEYELPEGWSTVAASNRQEDRAGTHRLITPLLNRFIHLDVEVSHEDWMRWAVVAGIGPEVRGFLNWKPSLLFDFDPNTNKRAFPTPRSWEFVNRVLPFTPEQHLFHVAAGTIGEGAATEFIGFVRTYRDLPDPDEVLKHPMQAHVPTEPSVLWALCGALTDRCKHNPKNPPPREKLANFVTYAGRLSKEFSVMAMRDGIALNPQFLTAPGASEWMKKHKHLCGVPGR